MYPIRWTRQVKGIACGSAWHVGMAAQYVIEDLADIPVRVELASEFRYQKMPFNKDALVIAISQSGETADTLAALRLAKEKGLVTLAIVNVVGSMKSSIDILFQSFKVFRRKWSGFWMTGNGSNGLLQNMPMLMMCSLLDAESIMR